MNHLPTSVELRMEKTHNLIHLRDHHIIRNLEEAKDDLSKTRSSLLQPYETKLDMYYREYINLNQEILKRIPATELEEHDELQIGADQLHTEALLRIKQLSASLAGKLVINGQRTAMRSDLTRPA